MHCNIRESEKKMQFKTMKKIEIMCLKVEALLIVTFAELIF